MQSRYNSYCKKCHRKINKGDEIIKTEKWGWIHEDCPTNETMESVNNKPYNPLKGINIPVSIEGSKVVGVEDTSESLGKVSLDWTPSKYQISFFEWLVNDDGNAVLEAVAGSGKTTTCIRSLKYIPLAVLVAANKYTEGIPFERFDEELEMVQSRIPEIMQSKNIGFLAFNKHIVKELSEKLYTLGIDYVHVSTIHSLGYAICRKLEDLKYGPDAIDKDKVGGIMDKWYPITTDVERSLRSANFGKRHQLRRMVSLAKSTLVDYNDANTITAMMERFGMEDDENTAELVELLPQVMQACIDNIETIDYDDMVWLPVVHPRLKLHFDKFHYLFIDEAQDLNNCQAEFIKLCLYPYSRVVAVGDRFQSLYGFRGADTEAIPTLIKTLNAKVLPLSISYRCPASVVKLAQGIVPHIEASETAKEGTITRIEYKNFMNEITVGDMVICRTNAPLVKPAYAIIRGGKKAIIRGRDIGKSLVNFIERFEVESLGQLEILMREYTDKETQRLLDKGKELQAADVMDKLETILSVSAECKTVDELTERVAVLFNDSNAGVVFSSVHRAKGLEAERIFILREDLMPHPKARQDWEQVQEQNIRYVAYTRSKSELFFVEGEDDEDLEQVIRTASEEIKSKTKPKGGDIT